MTLVVDASVAFKWFAQEDGTDRALQLLERGEPIVAPDLILAEVCNAAWKSLRRGELAPPQFDAILSDIAQPFSRLVPLDQLIRPAAALTRRLDHPIYDCLYLALADSEGLPVVTADQRLLAAVRGRAWPSRYCGSDWCALGRRGGSVKTRGNAQQADLADRMALCCDGTSRRRRH